MIARVPATILIGAGLFGLIAWKGLEMMPRLNKEIEWAWEPLLWGVLMLGLFLFAGTIRFKDKPIDDKVAKSEGEPLVAFGEANSTGRKPYTGTPPPPRAHGGRSSTPAPARNTEATPWVNYPDE